LIDIAVKDGKAVYKIREVDASLKTLDKTGKTTAAGGMQKMATAFAAMFTAAMAYRGLKGFLGTGIDFETQMLKVKAVSKATESEFANLMKTARYLGRTTTFTASQVASLELSLSKLGFTSRETVAATAGILKMAQATQSDLGEAAVVAGATLRAFNMDARESGKVADIMAASFTSSALDMDKFRESMKYISPIAASVGVSIEEATAAIALLADRGIHGSMAGTAMRMMLLKLAGPTSAAA
ncbi:unnamed protein product, partial [marine sediment metagenome]